MMSIMSMLKYCIEKELHLQMSTRRSFRFFITRCFWTLYCLFLCQREGDTSLHSLTDLTTTHLSFFPQRFLLLRGIARNFNLLVTLYKLHLCFMCIIAGMVVDLGLLQMGGDYILPLPDRFVTSPRSRSSFRK